MDYGKVELTIEKALKERGISKTKFCHYAELQRKQLNAYYNNNRQRVDLDILARMCYILKCDLDDLMVYTFPEK